MSESETQKDPMEMLSDIHSVVSDMDTDTQEVSSVRWEPDADTTAGNILIELADNGWKTAKEIKKGVNSDVDDYPRPLTHMYRSFLVDRRKRAGKYEYKVTPEAAIPDAGDEQATIHPWDRSDVGKAKWHVLSAVDGQPNPKSNDIESALEDVEDVKSTSARPFLSKLYDSGHVERTPDSPYIYWLTELGKEQIE